MQSFRNYSWFRSRSGTVQSAEWMESRLFPHKIRGEGHFLALLQKKHAQESKAESAEESESGAVLAEAVEAEKAVADQQNQNRKKKNKAIKTVLLDQSIMTGIGNIYANEICYQMHLNPYTKANVLSKKRVKELVDVACEILNKAILQGGTTIHSFSANGIDGLFQVQLKVHMQKHCPLGHEIKKVMINERGTYYCPICQKAKR